MSSQIIKWQNLSTSERAQALSRPVQVSNIKDKVEALLNEVKTGGDKALLRLAKQYDGFEGASLKVPQQQLKESWENLPANLKESIDVAIANIDKFHSAQKKSPLKVQMSPGIECTQYPLPIERVGFYIPGGTAPLFSSVLMLATPAKIAGCKDRILCTPNAHPTTLAAAYRTGVTEVYSVGGAQAIAAMSFGTETIPAVSKIFGPGNSWVTEAKNQVSPGTAIDMPAGPSEVLIVADKNANPEFLAWDLLSQAEHGPDSQVLLIANDSTIIEKTQNEIQKALENLPRKDLVTSSLEQSRFILTNTLEEAMEISNIYAPEHLILNTKDAENLIPQVKNAGSIFVGPWSPESCGDYASGTNHVLPTHGAARAYSGVSLNSFFKWVTLQRISKEGLQSIGPHVVNLAEAESLYCHAQAVAVRLKKSSQKIETTKA